MTATAHIIGAGVAGLAAAVHLVGRGRKVALYEAAGQAGGRCRSLHDKTLGRLIDNGNHLIMAGNRATFAYLDAIGARDRMVAPNVAQFPFLDLRTGERWMVRPNGGLVPWWPFVPGRRVAGTGPADYLMAVKLPFAGPASTVADVLGRPEALFRRLWDPLATAALNTDPAEAAARLLWPVLAQTFLRGEAYCRPYVAEDGLSPALIEPAVAKLSGAGAGVFFSRRLRAIQRVANRVASLDFTDGPVELGPADQVILAITPNGVAALLPEIEVPDGSRAIVNAHYLLDEPAVFPANSRFLGLIGGTAQWLFVRGPVLSVTVSAADDLAARDNAEIAARLWRDVALALGRPNDPQPPARIINERRATFAQTPDAVRRRPGPVTTTANLFLAGDWTDTGLPATIESAVRSGQRAATLATRQLAAHM